MEKMITVKPVFWRLLIWKVLPLVIGWLLGDLSYQIAHHYSSLTLPWAVMIGIIVAGLIGAPAIRDRYNIVIAGGKITGASTGLITKTVTFPIVDINWPDMHKQSFYEKIFGYHMLRSINGPKIMFKHFIYGQSAVNRVYRILESVNQELTDAVV
ncbi:MAG TPA: hypothetical protein VK206_11605 [Anaerolineales bacterium]|nr:hypothetical protein [Anaerolineales bacterium]HLO30700.1 hypothetical protein [Anaerolineales bacterium]